MKYDLIVVSSYPRFGTTRDKFTVGVADYAKQTLTSLPSTIKILVLAEKLTGQPETYSEKNITVNRIWQRNNILSFFNVFKAILAQPRIPILFEFEMAMYGNPLLNVAFVNLLFILKLFSRQTFVALHQVVLDFNEISGHIGQSQNSPINNILNILAKLFYTSVISFSSRTIVFEQFLKNRLSQDNSKITVIPMGVVQQPHIVPVQNKEFVITVFGYLAWYKGTDWVVKTFSDYFDKHPQSNFKLVIAGGANPNHLDKPYYQKYLSNIKLLVARHPRKIILTDYIHENKIGTYYRQSDLILLPYRVGMSSSGPLALAFTYHKPFLVSTKIAPILDTFDIKNIIDRPSVEFELTSKSLFAKVLDIQKHPKKSQSLSSASQQISNIRSWSNISHLYLKCLNL